jgi:hypothetical protein
MKRSTLQLVGAILLVSAAVAGARAASPPQAARITPQPKPIKTTPPKDWADAKTVAKHKKDAEQRALFASSTPLAFTLTGNFKAIQSDRTPNSTKTFPATIEFQKEDGSSAKIDLPIRTRGQVRRSYDVCEFAPIRLEFPKDQMKGTVFDGQHVLKLGVHCRNVKEFETYPQREYAAYRIFNLLSPRSFRTRLVRVTYVDTGTNKSLGTHNGVLIEDDDDVAKRLEGRLITQRELLSGVDRDAFTLMTLFEYMIGNLDVSIITEHNVKLVQMPTRTVFPIPYDFDYSGLVDATYALPPPGMGITTVRDRVYRGPCRTMPELETFFAKFRAIKADLPAIYDSMPDLDQSVKRKALAYLDQFYKTLDRPADVKTAFIDHCLKSGLM